MDRENQANTALTASIDFLLAGEEAYIPSFQLTKIDSQFEKSSINYQQLFVQLKKFKIAKTPSYLKIEDATGYSSIENYLFAICAKSVSAQLVLTLNETLAKDVPIAVSPEVFFQKVISNELPAEIPFLSLQEVNKAYEAQLEMAFDEVIGSGWYLLGGQLKKFEANYAQFNSVNYCIGVSNGLDALHLSLLALGIGVGDEVIVPSNTYIATVLAVSYVGATPVFVEPDIQTYNIDKEKIEEKITKKTKAIMPVHLYGQACEMDVIMGIAQRHSLYVVEDNAQSQGAMYKNKLTGSFGKINGTSFYPGKNLGALGDAGAITTDELVFANKVSILRNYGSEKKYFNEIVGYNMRMDEIQAAFLNVKLKDLEKNALQRQVIAEKYNHLLDGIGDLVLPVVAPGATHVYHLYVIRTRSRDSLQEYLRKNGVATLIHYPIPPHLQKAYQSLGLKKGSYPLAEEIADTCLSLPIWPSMSEQQVIRISATIKSFFDGN